MHISSEFVLIFVGSGDWKQLKPVNESHIDFRNSHIVKYLCDYKNCQPTKIHRFDDDELLQDAHDCANGIDVDISKYGTDESDLCLAWTNECVNALNTKWNEHHAQGLNDDSKLTVDGNDKTKIILHAGLELVSHSTPRTGKRTNSEALTIKSWQKSRGATQLKISRRQTKQEYYKITLQSEDGEEIIVEDTDMIDFRPTYALTLYNAQGMTINRPYSIYEYDKMDFDMRCVALTRTRKIEYVNLCSIDVLKPYSGSIYDAKCKTTGKRYVGSTKDVKARWNEHKPLNKTDTKFANALAQYSVDDFEFTIVATINYANRDDLYKLEDEYILKFNSINNGYNSRLNLRSSVGPSK